MVPAGATFGRLTAITPAGTAQSPADFFVPPPGFTASDVVATGRIAINGSTVNAALTAPYKIALIVFDGTAGQAVSLGVVSVSN